MKCPRCDYNNIEVYAGICPQCRLRVSEVSQSLRSFSPADDQGSTAAVMGFWLFVHHALPILFILVFYALVASLDQTGQSFPSSMIFSIAFFNADLLGMFSRPNHLIVAAFYCAYLLSFLGAITIILRRRWGVVPVLLGGIGQVIGPLYGEYVNRIEREAAQNLRHHDPFGGGVEVAEMINLIGWLRWWITIGITILIVVLLLWTAYSRRTKS